MRMVMFSSFRDRKVVLFSGSRCVGIVILDKFVKRLWVILRRGAFTLGKFGNLMINGMLYEIHLGNSTQIW